MIVKSINIWTERTDLSSTQVEVHAFNDKVKSSILKFNLKVSSGGFHMSCLLSMESSKASVKETCLFHSRDGITMTLMDVQ